MVNQKFFFEMISQLDVPRHEGSEVGALVLAENAIHRK